MNKIKDLRCFKSLDGRNVVLRLPKWSDLDDILEFVNSLVEEGAEIGTKKKVTRIEEINWLAKHLIDIELMKKVAIVAEVESKFAGQLEVRFLGGSSSHVGALVIALGRDYRNLGIGTQMMFESEVQAQKLGCKILMLEVFASNKRARNLYERLGYRVVGSIPKGFMKNGSYIDKIIMTKEL